MTVGGSEQSAWSKARRLEPVARRRFSPLPHGLDEDGQRLTQLIASRMKHEKGRDIADACAADPDLLARVVRGSAEDHNHDASTPAEVRATIACEELEAVMAWRDAQGVDAILDTDLPFADEFHESWPVTIHGCDAFGHPVVAERIEDIRTKGLARNMDTAAVLRHRVQIMEAVGRFKRREGERRGHALYKHIWVIDLAGLKVGSRGHGPASRCVLNYCHPLLRETLMCARNQTHKYTKPQTLNPKPLTLNPKP